MEEWLDWTQRLENFDSITLPGCYFEWNPQRRRKSGRPKIIWRRTVKGDIKYESKAGESWRIWHGIEFKSFLVDNWYYIWKFWDIHNPFDWYYCNLHHEYHKEISLAKKKIIWIFINFDLFYIVRLLKNTPSHFLVYKSI